MLTNIEVIRQYFAACEAGDHTIVGRLYSPDFVSRASDGSTFGVEQQESLLKDFLATYRDLKIETHSMRECGDSVVTHYTHHARLGGSDFPLRWSRIVIHTLKNGRIVDVVAVSDSLSLHEGRERARTAPRTSITPIDDNCEEAW